MLMLLVLVNTVVLLSSIFIVSLANIIIITKYKKHKFKELKLISITLTLVIIHAITFLIFLYVIDDKLVLLRKYANIISNLLAAFIQPYLILYLFLKLSGKKFTGRFLIYMYFSGISFSFYVIQQDWIIINNMWAIKISLLASLSVGINIIIIELEKLYIMIVNYRISRKSTDSIYYLLICVSGIIVLFSLIVFVFERSILDLNTFFYLLIGNIGFSIFAITVAYYPFVLSPKTISAKILFVYDKSTSRKVYEYKFLEKDKWFAFKGDNISSIISLLNALTDQPDPPKELNFLNLTITIEETDDYIAYFISNRTIDPIRVMIQYILQNIDLDENEHISKYIDSEFNFVR